MQVATGAMSTLLPKLADLLKEEYNLQKRVKGEIMFLKAELESMEAALLKISEAPIDQPPDIQVKLWAKAVRDLSYDIEDSIDRSMVRIDSSEPNKPHSFRGFIDRGLDLMKKAKIRRKIGVDIKDIKGRIREVRERRDNYKVDNVAAKPIGPTIDSLRLAALYKKATELVGTEEKTDELVKRLTEGSDASKKELKVVSIVGFGGLGKTTLANVVYQKLRSQFDCGAFVSVSLNPNMEKIFKGILHQLDKLKYNSINEAMWGEEQLISELRDFLLNKRYFIVIDDIWNNYAWKTIKHALLENKCGSRIMTTTRILDVAKQIGGVYELKPLSPIDSRELFYQRIFGVEDKCPPNQLVEVSENILHRCGGVPLAIITTASMLASKNENDWSKVYQSMGSGLQDSPDIKHMRKILSISYYDLPAHLKTCLLFISLYPEDYEIQARYLIWQWIGEGFVREEQGKSLYEVGQDYLDELINRSLIQPEDISRDNKLDSFRVHDMVLDLISFLSSEENFLTTIGGQQPMSAPSKVRRLFVQAGDKDDLKQLSTMNMSHVRSFGVFCQDISLLPALSNFPVLRALDLSYCLNVDNHHVKIICNMFHLRYLWLSNTSITKIPEEIGNLRFLQVLDISVTGVEVFPSTFVQLTQLVYLCVSCATRLPDGFGNLKSLQDFSGITITSSTMLHDLGRLTELRDLRIYFHEWNESYEEPFRQCLSKLVHLKTIKVNGVRYLGAGSGFDNLSPGPQKLRSIHLYDDINCALPRWISSLSCISILVINRLETLRVEDLQVLGSMPSLIDLDISVVKSTQDRHERLVIDSCYPFRCLTRLSIDGPMELMFAQGAVQKLQTLELYLSVQQTVDQFGNLDFGLENISSLEHVRFYAVCRECRAKLEEVEAAIRTALDMNPNKPTLELSSVGFSLQCTSDSSRPTIIASRPEMK